MDETLCKRLEALTAAGRAQSLDFEGVAARVATDRFVAMSTPGVETCAQYEAMMSDALSRIDATNALRIAARLAPCPAAPQSTLLRLIALGPQTATPVFRLAAGLPAPLLLERAVAGDAREAAAIAARGDIDRPTVGALARRLESEVLHALAANRNVAIDRGAMVALTQRGRIDIELGRLLLARDDDTLDRNALFLSADAPARRLILLEAARKTLAGPDNLSDPFDAARQQALDAAASGDLQRFCSVLARALRTARSDIEPLARDPGGEPLGLVFAAMGLAASESERPLVALRGDLAAKLEDPMSGLRLAMQAPAGAASAILAALRPGRRRQTATGEYSGAGQHAGASAQTQARDAALPVRTPARAPETRKFNRG
ncbi:MAG: hypothetical protein ACK5JM_10295 [Rhodoblastus sp.]